MRRMFFLLFFFICVSMLHAAPKREMRGVWIATVANIDWPSKKGDVQSQKSEMVKMLDSLQSCHINTVVFQIRPCADAFYKSDIEPWSHYLTGEQGKAPSPFYDPLEFVIEEAHERCMEVHAWINPYRITNNENTKILSENSPYYKKSGLVKKYGGKYVFDPGRKATMDYLVSVVADIVKRYDIDAVHMDDYFYPYKVPGSVFSDEETFHRENRGVHDKEDWRRNNVDLVVKQLHDTIKSLKPWVELGVSPFGVWRNLKDDYRGSATEASVTNYDELYADILKWLENGWVDYVAPQLYWEIGKKIADYEVLASWWSEYAHGRNLYIGMYASGMEVNKGKAWKTPNELARQLHYNRTCDDVSCAIYYSARSFLKNIQGLKDSLRNDYYRYPALVPEKKGESYPVSVAPTDLKIEQERGSSYLRWKSEPGEAGTTTAYYVVYCFEGKKVGDLNDPSNIFAVTADPQVDVSKLKKADADKYAFVVTQVNRYRVESLPSEIYVWKK